MRIAKQIILTGSALIGTVSVPLHAKAMESLPALERQLALFLGKQQGEVGGARSNIDRRLRLNRCTRPIDFQMRGKGLVVISCGPSNWRVPVALEQSPNNGDPSSRNPLMVKRGQPVLLVIEKDGFMISRQMQADRNGGIGDIIPVRASRKSSPILAEITGQGRVSLPSHQQN
ncbi:flagella basal body P-ring formation protein FlgA [Parasphingorhabdus cellanae]|uniref:Flagella basal body P-ring formation protein FlgA n=1 Tax=Parasphingorhabdus cellanae TaxID=2806553 RepID=A0ABX7T7Q7_9SPHN|nr:flagella basal body P-ring formation protein FlgA [Parasphingorhabdus cellanae]QTD56489.1 flagella basal body P-ring formation protein FlgA [Parasphingorhabdus cellanae]